MIELDYCAFQCPYPVVETRKQLLTSPKQTVTVLVSEQIAIENITRLATKMGYQTTTENAGQNFKLTLTPGNSPAPATTEPPAVTGKTIVFCNSDQMGQGDEEFGQILLKNFLVTLLELDRLPDVILFVNSGVKLVASGSGALEALEQLAGRGVDIAACGLCLDFYHLKEQLKIGRTTNMLEIAETQMQAARVINP